MTIPAGFAQITWFFTGGGIPQGAAVTWGVGLSFAGTLLGMAQGARDEWQVNFTPLQTNDVSLVGVRVKAGPDDTGPFVEISAAIPGTAAGDIDAPQVSVLLEKVTALGGRRGRGRMYVPGAPTTAFTDGGSLTGAALTAWTTAATAFLADINQLESVADSVLLHSPSKEGTENPSPEPPPTTITSLIPDPVSGTQRRRLRR